MGYFPMCVNLEGRRVLCVGAGPQIEDKLARLRPFRAALELLPALSDANLEPRPALVVIGGLARAEAAAAARLCACRGIPVNVVDAPELCTFTFPALITRGELTISINTGGRSPAAAAQLRRRIERELPERLDEILDWLTQLRAQLQATLPPAQRAALLNRAAALAFERGRPLEVVELDGVAEECGI